jgi:hypothetical protein
VVVATAEATVAVVWEAVMVEEGEEVAASTRGSDWTRSRTSCARPTAGFANCSCRSPRGH